MLGRTMLAIPPQSEGLRAATANNRPPLRPFRPHTAARAPPGGNGRGRQRPDSKSPKEIGETFHETVRVDGEYGCGDLTVLRHERGSRDAHVPGRLGQGRD